MVDVGSPTPSRRPTKRGRLSDRRRRLDHALTLRAAARPAPTRATEARPLEGRRFLIVTIPFGPFGGVFADVLEARGATVRRMIFNAGDATYWRRPGAERFKAPAHDWPARLAVLARDFTDIVVFGEGGPYNQAVLSAGETLGCRVWVMENGYFRPDWVTVEEGGVNASSRLPRRREGYEAPPPEVRPAKPIGTILPHHVVNISLYHTVQFLGGPLYPAFEAPYTQSPVMQCVGHIRRYFGLSLRRSGPPEAAALAARGPFFLACLQREGDAQLLRYSSFADNTAFMAEVMASFARSAPTEARLVVKNHPLDPGLVDLARITRLLAVEHGLAGRVEFIDGGVLSQLCRASRGMVVNNSSAALSALGFHTPVKVLGQAFFDFEGLTDQKPLDAFWSDPKAADPELFGRFRGHVIARTQINGNYHQPDALRMTAEGLAEAFARPAAD